MKKIWFGNKIITSAIAVTLVTAITATSIHFSKKEVEAKETFQGIKDIVESSSEENPFQILEITPGSVDWKPFETDPDPKMQEMSIKLSTGQIGYYIGGGEPTDFMDQLANFELFDYRKGFVGKFIKLIGDAIDPDSPLSAITVASGDTAPLKYSDYREMYALTQAEIESAKVPITPDEKPVIWNKINFEGDHMDEVREYIVQPDSVSDNRLVKAFAPIPAITDIADAKAAIATDDSSTYFKNAIISTGEGDFGTGDFDPAFSLTDSDNEDDFLYNVKFVANNAKAGYKVKWVRPIYQDELESGEIDEGGKKYTLSGNYIFTLEGSDTNWYKNAGKYNGFADSKPVLTGAEADVIPTFEEEYDEYTEIETDYADDEDDSDNNDDGNGDDEDVEIGEPEEEPDIPNDEVVPVSEDNDEDGEEVADAGSVIHFVKTLETFMSQGIDEPGDGDKKPDDDKKKDDDKDPEEGKEPDKEKEPEEGIGEPEVDTPGDEDESEEEIQNSDEEVSDERTVSKKDEEQEDIEEEEEEEEAYEEETGAAHEESDYYLVCFEFDNEYSEDCHYSIESWEEYPAATPRYERAYYAYNFAKRKVDDTEEFITAYPNYANTGALKSRADDDPVLTALGLTENPFAYEGAITDDDIMYGNYKLIYTGDVGDILRLYNVPTYYTGGFDNNEWFKKFVFDREFNTDGKLSQNVDLNVLSLDAANASGGIEVTGVGLLYLSSGTTSFLPKTASGTSLTAPKYGGANDISPQFVKDVLYAVVEDNLPVIVDFNLLDSSDFDGTNMQLLARILQLKDVDKFYREFVAEAGSANFNSNINKVLPKGKTTTPDNTVRWFEDNRDTHHVNKSIYVFNPDTVVNLANTKFTDTEGFSDDNCFGEISELISSENFYLENDGVPKDRLIKDERNEAVAIKYIISFAGRRTAYLKSAIKILEIEPCTIPFAQPYEEDYEDSFTTFSWSGKKADSDLNSAMSEGHLYVVKDTSASTYSLYRRKNGGSVNKSADPATLGTCLLKNQKSPIYVKRMCTTELIGSAKNLNSEYDLIYIGMNTTFFYKNNGTTVFNDSNMNGLIYMNIGDIYRTEASISGLMNRDYSSGDYINGGKLIDGNNNYASTYRLAGNDLTKRKADELLDYVKASYPVIVDNRCYSGSYQSSKVNAGKGNPIDNCSNMYYFLNAAANGYERNGKKQDGLGVNKKNLLRLSENGDLNVEGGRKLDSLLQEYVNLPKPELDLDTQVSWTEKSQPVHAGDYMKYEFTVLDRRSTDSSFDYLINLYIDQNVDGRYAESEKVNINDFELVTASGKDANPKKLKKGTKYILSYKVPNTIQGPIPWKLSLALANNTERSAEKTGCYKIHRGEPDKIRILQIMPDNPGGSWELPKTYNGAFGGLMKEFESINDYYDTKICVISNSDFMNLTMRRDANFENVLNTFNFDAVDGSYHYVASKDTDSAADKAKREPVSVLVLGFAQRYTLFLDSLPANPSFDQWNAADHAQKLVVDYIKKGRATVLGSGVTSLGNVKNYNSTRVRSDIGDFRGSYGGDGYNLNMAIRELVGQDRYGVTNEKVGATYRGLSGDASVNNSTIVDEAKKSGRAVCYVPNSMDSNGNKKICGFPQGYSALTVSLWGGYLDGNNKYKLKNAGNIDRYNANGMSPIFVPQNSSAKRMNEGIITLYPFDMEREVKYMGPTKYPLYSLDLESVNNDGEQEVFVWYTFDGYANGNGTNQYMPLDARDSYFLYTKDNITVMNVSQPSGTWQNENKFMANVLIAAFESGVKQPVVHFVDNEVDRNDITSIRIPYDDITDKDTLAENATQDLYFYSAGAMDNSDLLASFYFIVDLEWEAENGLTKVIDGNRYYVRRLPILSIENVSHPEKNPVEFRVQHLNTEHDEYYQGYSIDDNDVYKLNVDLNYIMYEPNTNKLKDSVDIVVEVNNLFADTAHDWNNSYSVTTAFDTVQLLKTELFHLD